MKNIRIIIVDDEAIYRRGFISLIEGLTGNINNNGVNEQYTIEKIYEASNGHDLMNKCATSVPDIVFLDIKMPIVNGIEALIEVKNKFPDTKVIILTNDTSEITFANALMNKCNGFLLKSNITLPEIQTCIESLHSNLIVINSSEALSSIANRGKIVNSTSDYSIDDETLKNIQSLSETELKVLSHIASGYDNNAIGCLMYLDKKTVANYVSKIYFKLDIKGRLKLISLGQKYFHRQD